MKLDVFNHICPRDYWERMLQVAPKAKNNQKRARGIPAVVDLDARFRVMDLFDEYAQIISLPNPPIESFGGPALANELARMGNDGLATLVQKYPNRFPGFVASLPMNDPDGLLREANRAVKELGAVGVQAYTNINGRPITNPDTMPLFDLMADMDKPIWLHPAREPQFSDYQTEKKSHYEIWWAFGWPYETSAAMAHIVFTGLFDKHPNLKIITHHGGGMIPFFEGRLGPGMDLLGSRTTDEDYEPLLKSLKKRPLDYFKMFYADTATFGGRAAVRCALDVFGEQNLMFATDMPFDPEGGAAYIRMTIEILDQMDITAAQRFAIYEGNARRMMNLK
jgi:uncharacterized protein